MSKELKKINNTNITYEYYKWYNTDGTLVGYSTEVPGTGGSGSLVLLKSPPPDLSGELAQYGEINFSPFDGSFTVHVLSSVYGWPKGIHQNCTYETITVVVPLIVEWGKYGDLTVTKSKGLPYTVQLGLSFPYTILNIHFMPQVSSGRLYYHLCDGSCDTRTQFHFYVYNPTSATSTVSGVRYVCIGF